MNTNTERPVFLIVLCILGFIFLGLSMVSNLISLAFLPFYKNLGSMLPNFMFQAFRDIYNNAPQLLPLIESIYKTVAGIFMHIKDFILINLICSIVAIYGVFMMWQLKKIGYYLFSLAKILAVIIPVALIQWSILSGLILFSGLLVSGVFILLFGLNLKHME